MNAPIVCSDCSTPVPATYFNAPGFVPCPICGAELMVRVFPALTQPLAQGISGDRITEAGQAACFYHPNKTAHVPCDACGRFVCALCDVELQGQHLCPACVESGRRKGALTTLESRRVLWDNIALWTATFPVLFLAAACITSPAAIILAIIGWRKPRSLVPRWSRFRFVFAIVFSLATLGGIGFLIYIFDPQTGFFQ